MLNLNILATGLSGLIAQVLILRELLVNFRGNELTLGLILGNWVVAEALGAFLPARFADKAKHKDRLFIILQVFFFLAFFAAVYFSRVFKDVLNIPFGETAGLNLIFNVSLAIIFLPAFFHGALFTCSCAMRADIGRTYAWETFGTLLGGAAVTYLFIPHFNSFQATFILLLIAMGSGFFLLKEKLRSLPGYLSLFLIILSAAILTGGKAQELQQDSINRQWKGVKVLAYRNSAYGNIVAAQKEGQLTFFYNGVPLVTSPYPDISFVQEFGNLPFLFHPGPRDILIAGTGAGGLINEMLKYPVKRLDYVELDPQLISMLKEYPSSLTRKELGDPRVNIINQDARAFIKNTSRHYDLILIGLSSPQDLSANRFFSREFFSLAKDRLYPQGICAFWLPGSVDYLGQELRDLNSCILGAFKLSFPYQRIIAGDYSIFLGSGSSAINSVTPSLIEERIRKYGINPGILLPVYLDYRLSPLQEERFRGFLKSSTGIINSDARPYAVFAGSLLWNRQFSPGLTKYFGALRGVSLKGICIAVFILTVLFYFRRPGLKSGILYCIGTTGFFGMLLNLCLLFGFQVVFGSLYQSIGLMIAVFMGGIAAGSLVMNRMIPAIENKLRAFIALEGTIILYSLFSAFVFSSFAWGSYAVFILLFFSCGLALGLEFSLASAVYPEKKKGVAVSAGALYAADLCGGWLAGLLSGAVLIPVAGIFNSCLIACLLKLSSFLILLKRSEMR